MDLFRVCSTLDLKQNTANKLVLSFKSVYVLTGYTDIAKLLIQRGADVETQNIHGASSLHACAIQGHGDILQVFSFSLFQTFDKFVGLQCISIMNALKKK